jgi:hypothetical protein
VFAASIIRAMMEATSNSETSVNFYQTTRCNIPEESHLTVLLFAHFKSNGSMTPANQTVIISDDITHYA